ncbi:ASCH domain-containing protein [Cyclobacterium marinum]|uniref:ASCH domain-containing protein n=1 Tax=Cyclobacterium marinum TaxID=104 RepID=UPI0030D93119|tara:strand:- start:42440 stop:42865 length:426 start_codon:yes stop_codon:yes gene_type:complete
MLLGFKKQFAGPILDGTKIFTIREKRKVEPKIGETLHMYSGLRTKHTELISKEHTLTGIQLVDIAISEDRSVKPFIKWVTVYVDERQLSNTELNVLAVSDGFTDLNDFCNFWLKGGKPDENKWVVVLKKDLVMHHWTDFRF